MSKCTCPDSVCWDGIRYCPDCDKHTVALTQEELERKMQEIRYEKAREELLETS